MVQKFLDAIRKDPKAKELIKAMPAPKSDAEAVEGYVRLAKDLGFDLTIDEIKAGLKALEEGQKNESDKVALDVDDLENVAGGANDGCDDTHVPGEWCWFTDSCSYIITYYNMQPDGTPNTPQVKMTTCMAGDYNPQTGASTGCEFTDIQDTGDSTEEEIEY